MTYSRTFVPPIPFRGTIFLLPPAGPGVPGGWCSWAVAFPSVHDMYLLSGTYR
jgi:hypothetical protein